MKKLLFFWNELKSTFWFIPVLIILLSILFSIGFVFLDENIEMYKDGLPKYFLVNNPDSARSILSTISGAMIGAAGTVFSVTLVALTLASSQFGPRLIKNFMHVRLNQVVLGSYISTYLYCLLVLNAIKETDGDVFIPSVSILVAIVVAILNIILLIVFIHNIAISIQADKVVSDISDFIAKQVVTLFPEKMGDEHENEKIIDLDKIRSGFKHSISVKCPKSGYLQYIDNGSLMETVKDLNGVFELYFRPGAYMVEGMEIGKLQTSQEIEKEALEKITSNLVIGKTKTSQQDLEFSIHQMVEIAARALSPGVNDPYTAITCIDNLTATLSYLAQAKFPSRYQYDDENNLRLISDILDFEGVLDAAFNQIRQFSGGSTAVIIRLMEALITINGFTEQKAHKKAVIKHAKMVLDMGKASIVEENDLNDLKERSKKLIKTE
jgi:uncharacterized membrane protein